MCLAKGLVEQTRQAFEVVARGKLGHDTAEGLVHVDLRMDHVAEDAAPIRDDRDRRLVARCLDA